jgi:phage gpG-like protein
MQLQFNIEGEMQLSRNLEAIAANSRDWTQAFEQASDYLMNIFENDVFDTEGQAIDEQWDPLSKAYALQKARKYPDKGILEATGAMRNSFWKQIDSTSMTIGNSAEYFKYHQSNQPRSKLPRRVMLKLTNEMKAEIVRKFQEQYFADLQT